MPEALPINIIHGDGSSTVIHQFKAAEQTKGICVLFPAMGVKASYYETLAIQLAEGGFTAYTVDLRGNGHSSLRPNRKVNFGYKDVLDFEYATSIQHVRKLHPSEKLFLFGHSLGGQLSCLFASRQSVKIDGLILSATCSVYYKGWPGFSAYRILAATQFINMIAKLMGYFPGKKLGFGGTEARGIMSDWSRQARTGCYKISTDSNNYEKSLGELTLPVLAISYQGDKLAPEGAVDHLLDKLKASKKEHLHLKKNDLRNDGFSHFSWAKKPKNIVAIVDDWVKRIP